MHIFTTRIMANIEIYCFVTLKVFLTALNFIGCSPFLGDEIITI